MIARILVGLGGTPFTPIAIRYAVELAQAHQAEVLGMTVIDRRRLGALTRTSGATQQAVSELKRLEKNQELQEQAIIDFKSACAGADLKHGVVRESGDPFEKMTSQARYYDLMIFGLRSLFDYDLVNTDASDVLARLVCRGVRPILAVSKEYRPIQRVLLAYSGSTESAKAIKRFMSMQMWPDLTVKVITFEHPREIAVELLAGIAGYCRACGYEPEIEHIAGPAKQLLLQHATEWNADAIIVGNSARSFWLKKLLGETALHTVRHANIPLFLSQ